MPDSPTIVAWNRLEPRPRSNSFSKSLRAEVRDPLWMLTRQWQMREFKAQDRVSPAFARVLGAASSLFEFQPQGSPTPEGFPSDLPLEARVERSALPKDFGLTVQIGRHWLKLLKKAGLEDFSLPFIQQFPISGFEEEQFSWGIANPGTSGFKTAMMVEPTGGTLGEKVRGMMDGLLFYKSLTAGEPTSAFEVVENWPGYDTGVKIQINLAESQFKAWYQRLYSQPATSTDTAWDSNRMEHRFSISPQATLTLPKETFHCNGLATGTLDWYSFNKTPNSIVEEDGNSPGQVGPTFLPNQIQFPGMPASRWWEFEDYQVNFENISAAPSDMNRLVFLEFMYNYRNDWFALPLGTSFGSRIHIDAIVVTDTFGFEHEIRSSHSRERTWNMFSVSTQRNLWDAREQLFLLPPVLNKMQESEPIEKISFIRDEMANMVWGIEKIIPNGLGGGMDGAEVSTLYKDALRQDSETTVTSNDEEEYGLPYRLASNIPLNWVPFVPTQVEGSLRDVQLQRAKVPEIDTISTNSILSSPKTYLLQNGLNTLYAPLFINEEEITRAGTTVQRTFQRARWLNGKTVVWCGYKKHLGRGEGNSGLVFDQIRTLDV